MVTIDPETYIGGNPPTNGFDPPDTPDPAPYSEKGTMWIQSRLNMLAVALSHDPETLSLLKVDGDYGRLTEAMVRNFQTFVGLPVDGQAGDATTAAMDAELSKIK
jgi:peptidoglycan hydrolase-like protein with peptidoglycan-binding domain